MEGEGTRKGYPAPHISVGSPEQAIEQSEAAAWPFDP